MDITWNRLNSRASLGHEAAGVGVGVGAGVDRAWLNKRVSTIPSFSLNQYGLIGNDN